MLAFRSGSSASVSSRRAMEEAVEVALEGADASAFPLLVFHCTIGHDFAQLLETARRMLPAANIVGCTCHGVISREGANETMKGLAVMAVSGAKDALPVAVTDNIRGHNSEQEATRMARELRAKTGRGLDLVLLLASGIDIAADRAIAGIESVFGPNVKIIGGTSSDNMRALSSYQFINDKVLERGAVLVGIDDPDLDLVTGVHHGSVLAGSPFTVTRAEANRVFSLDDHPAWPTVMDRLGKPHDTPVGPCIPFSGMAVELPKELQDEYDNSHILRAILKTEADGSFYMPVDVPVGTRLWLTERDEEKIFAGLQRLLDRMSARLAGRAPIAMLQTDCAARGRALFSRVLKDEIVSRMQAPFFTIEPIPWLGMYGFGEFTPLAGRNFFHNYTTSLYCLTKRGG